MKRIPHGAWPGELPRARLFPLILLSLALLGQGCGSSRSSSGLPSGEADAAEVPPPEPEESPTSPPPESEVPADEGFVVDLPPEEIESLRQQTEADLRLTEEILLAWEVDGDPETATEESLQTVRDFVRLSREALEHQDLVGASNLALKARILAQEIGLP